MTTRYGSRRLGEPVERSTVAGRRTPAVRLRSALTAVVGAAVVVLGLPGAAHAADPPVVESAHSDSAGDLGTLVVSTRSSSDVTSVVAHIVDRPTGTEVAVSGDFVLRSGT